MNTPRPYLDHQTVHNKWIREFDPVAESHEYVWHRDKKDRRVVIMEGDGWFFQMDEDIPYELFVGNELYIPAQSYHRIFKAGSTPLKIEIAETE